MLECSSLQRFLLKYTYKPPTIIFVPSIILESRQFISVSKYIKDLLQIEDIKIKNFILIQIITDLLS